MKVNIGCVLCEVGAEAEEVFEHLAYKLQPRVSYSVGKINTCFERLNGPRRGDSLLC